MTKISKLDHYGLAKWQKVEEEAVNRGNKSQNKTKFLAETVAKKAKLLNLPGRFIF